MSTISNSWCKFVLNEGIMPSSLIRRIRNDVDLSNDCHLLASLLSKREAFSDVNYEEITQLAHTAFDNDQVLTSWLIEMDDILNIIANFSGQNNMQDLLDGACSSFIKTCPWVTDEIKNNYLQGNKSITLNKNSRHNTHNRTMSNPKGQLFIEFLRKIFPNSSTPNNYKTAVNKWGKEIFGRDLWEIEDPQEMIDLYYQYEHTPDFIEKNNKYNKALSNGLKRYIEFLQTNEKR